MMRTLRPAAARLLVSCTLLAGMACTHPSQTRQTNPDQPAYLVVENTLTEPFRMYVSDGAQRLPVGTVNPLSTTRLRIPPSMVFPAISLEFLAVPVGGSNPAISERLVVNPGDEIHLRLAR